MPAFLYCPGRDEQRRRHFLGGLSHQRVMQKQLLGVIEVKAPRRMDKKTREIAPGIRKGFYFRQSHELRLP